MWRWLLPPPTPNLLLAREWLLELDCPSSRSDSLHFLSLRNAPLFLVQWQGALFSAAGSASLATHLSQVHWIYVLGTGTERGARHVDTHIPAQLGVFRAGVGREEGAIGWVRVMPGRLQPGGLGFRG